MASAIRATATVSVTALCRVVAIASSVSPSATAYVPPPIRVSTAPGCSSPDWTPIAAASSVVECRDRSRRSPNVSPGWVVTVLPVAKVMVCPAASRPGASRFSSTRSGSVIPNRLAMPARMSVLWAW